MAQERRATRVRCLRLIRLLSTAIASLAVVVPAQATPITTAIYFSNSNVPSAIRAVDLDGSHLRMMASIPGEGGIGGPSLRAVVTDQTRQYLFVTDSDGRLFRMNLDGSDTHLLVSNLRVGDLAIDVASQTLFAVINSSRIVRFSYDGSVISEVVDLSSQLPGQAGIGGLSLDTLRNQLFVTMLGDADRHHSDTLNRISTDGSDFETLIDFGVRPGKPGSTLADVKVDAASGLVYWTDQYSNSIGRIGVNGSNPLVLINDWGRYLALDGTGGIYWGSPVDGGLLRADLDGTNVQLLLAYGDDIQGIDFGPAVSIAPPVYQPLPEPATGWLFALGSAATGIIRFYSGRVGSLGR